MNDPLVSLVADAPTGDSVDESRSGSGAGAGTDPWTDSGTSTVMWTVDASGRRVGRVALTRTGDRAGDLRWSGTELEELREGLRLAVDRALGELGLRRVEARVAVDDLTRLRTASRAGLRREGVLRGAADDGSDQVLLARLADDPPLASRDGFIALLNAGLPTKRVIAHGVLRDPAGRVLLCELTYKREWDLPGGVVEPGESPRQGVVREVGEELGLEVVPQRLLTVNWLTPWRGWDDACVFVFDLGVHDAALPQRLALQPTEIAAVHWCDAAAVAHHGAAATGGLLAFLTDRPDGAPYLEGGVDPLP